MSTSNSEHQKTVSLPSFTGMKKGYSIWLKRIMAYATIKKFDEALDEVFVLPEDSSNLITTGR